MIMIIKINFKAIFSRFKRLSQSKHINYPSQHKSVLNRLKMRSMKF